MSGSEMHGLVQWLKSKGRSEVQDLLIRVRVWVRVSLTPTRTPTRWRTC